MIPESMSAATLSTPLPRSSGRPANASREDVLALAMHRYLRGERIDVQAIAAQLGLGRTTIYRWFGSRDGLIGQVLLDTAEPLFEEARAGPAEPGPSSCPKPSTASTAAWPALLRCVSSLKTSMTPRSGS